MCSCGGSTVLTGSQPASMMTSSGQFDQKNFINPGEIPNLVELEYIGPRKETFTIRGYRFGNNATHKVKTVLRDHVDFLLSQRTGEMPDFRVVVNGARMENRDPAAVGLAVSG